VREPEYELQLTAFRETDAHTAMARGLSEYLGQQTIEVGGRKLQLKAYTTWAEPEDVVTYPAVAIAAESGIYDRSFTPSYESTIDRDVRLMAFAEFQQNLIVDLWATDPRERSYLCAMVEESLNPVDWMYGMRLMLPFYHNAVATYEMLSSQYFDSSDDAMAKYRRAQFTVRANMTTYRLLRFPDTVTRFELEVGDSTGLDDND